MQLICELPKPHAGHATRSAADVDAILAAGVTGGCGARARCTWPFEQGDITPIFRDDTIWAAAQVALTDALTPDFECDFVRDDVGRATFSGIDGLRAAWVDWLSPWESYDPVIEDVIDASDGRVLVLTRDRACPKGANAEVHFVGAPVRTVRGGKVARIEFYWNRAEGLAAAGLSQ